MACVVAVLLPAASDPTGEQALAAMPTVEGVRFVAASAAASFDASLLPLVRCLVFHPMASASELAAFLPLLPGCTWVHSLSAGVDKLHALLPTLRGAGVALTNGRGAFSQSLAEYVLAAALHFTKQLPRCEANRRARVWEKFTMGVLAGKTMGFVGYGDIARAAGRLAAPFGVRLVALRRQPHAEGAAPPVAETFSSLDDPAPFYRQCDFVVCTLPLTEQTRRYVGAEAFAAMKPSCVFISLGRGATVDEAALVAALQQGTIAGAACDVFETEPLPESSPLWSCDNLLLTAHNADLTEDFFARAWKTWSDNFACFKNGEQLSTPVDLEAGY